MSEQQSEKMQIASQVAEAYELGKENLVTFHNLFLPTDTDVKSPWFHYKWSDELLNSTENFCQEGFRGSAKSTIIFNTYPQYCLTYPSKGREFILLICHDQTMATTKLRDIADSYLTNPLINVNLVKVNQNNATAFEVVVKDGEDTEHTVLIMAVGKGTSIRGLLWHNKRPEVVIIDDPEDLDDSKSDPVLERDWVWFITDVKFLGSKGSRIFIIGNNLGEKCLVERIFQEHKRLGFSVGKITKLDDDGKSNWEEYYPTAEILKEREDYRAIGNIEEWNRENMCLAVSPETQMFRKGYFRYYKDDKAFKNKHLSVYITCDLAISLKETADYSVVLTLGVDEDDNWYVLDVLYGRVDPDQMLDNVFTAYSKYHPIWVGIETVAYQRSFQHYLLKAMQQRRIYFPIKELVYKQSKEERISSIQPRFRLGKIFFREGSDWLAEMESELLAFPKGRHDKLTCCV